MTRLLLSAVVLIAFLGSLGPAQTTVPATTQSNQVMVADLIRQSRESIIDQRYEEALRVIDRILVVDPQNEYARPVRQLVEDRAALLGERIYKDAHTRPATAGAWRDEEVSPARIARDSRRVQERLAKVLPSLKFDAIALHTVVDFFRDVTDLNIWVNWRHLEPVGVTKDTPVSLRLEGKTAAQGIQEALDLAAGGAGKLAFEVEEGVVTIDTRESIRLDSVDTRVYDVRDLLPPAAGAARDQRLRDLIAQVQRIDPESWADHGGKLGAIKELSGQLIVTQAKDNHERITALLDGLRRAATQPAQPTK